MRARVPLRLQQPYIDRLTALLPPYPREAGQGPFEMPSGSGPTACHAVKARMRTIECLRYAGKPLSLKDTQLAYVSEHSPWQITDGVARGTARG